MKVYFNNRRIKVKVKSETALVEWIRKHDQEYVRNIDEFMEVYKERKRLFEGINLSIGSPEAFVSDLRKNKIIT